MGILNTGGTAEDAKVTGRRAKTRMVRVYDISNLKPKTAFKTSDQHIYGVHTSGAFVRLYKDRRSPKERKRARREAREQKVA